MRFDIIRRILSEFFNIDVIQVMGITDIDDKIIKRSQESNIPFTQLAKAYQEEFFQDMNNLNVSTGTSKLRLNVCGEEGCALAFLCFEDPKYLCWEEKRCFACLVCYR